MTYGFGQISFQPPALDAFGRQRTSNPVAQFESKFTYGNEERSYNTTTSGTGSATFVANTASYTLSTGGTASGASCIRQSWSYMRYYPGKSQLIQMTGVFGSAVTNAVKRIGYYDNNDGLFFVQDGATGFGVAVRTSTSGSPVDTIVYQTNWNIDKLDGTGPSGITLDFTKTQIMIIDFQWLGVGAIRFGFVVDGAIIYVHQVNNANVLSVVYMKSAWLPLRYEVTNVGTAGNTATLSQICSAVNSEGGADPVGNLFSATETSPVSVSNTAWTPIISVQVQTTLNTYQFRGMVFLLGIQTQVTGVSAMLFQLIENPTLTGANWTQTNAASATYYDISATAYSGGAPRLTISNARGATATGFGSADLSAVPGTIYTLLGRGVDGNSAAVAAMNWREVI